MKNRNTILLGMLLSLACFVVLPKSQAVNPPPDGGYAGGNTAEGQGALLTLTTGGFNTAIGFLSLRSNTAGTFNTAIGAGTLLSNTGDDNTATGGAALLSNTTGSGNTANGVSTLLHNTTGESNTAVGFDALFSNTTGNGNVAIGSDALSSSTAVGVDSRDGANVAIGPAALQHTNGTGSFSGGGNNAVGQDALQGNTTGFANNAFGFKALFSNTTAGSNAAFGDQALLSNTTGGGNTALGAFALTNNTTGITNTAVGFNAGFGVTTADNVIVIGTNVAGQNVNHSCFIGEIFGETSSNGAAVLINSDGKLGTITSSKRFKQEIRPMDEASEALFLLKPVRFRYKKQIDPRGTSQFGLVAEDVEKVNPDLVVRDKQGKPYSVRYDQVNAMLLNEFLKEHSKVEQQQAIIADLKSTLASQKTMFEVTATKQEKEIEALAVGLQKVSAQAGLNAWKAKTIVSGQPTRSKKNSWNTAGE